MQTIEPDTGGPAPDARGPLFPQLRRLALRDAFRQVARSRQFTREALEDWGWNGQDACEDAVLVVSELVTNAKLHAGGCHELMLRAGDAFRVEVYDGHEGLPRPLPALRPGRPGRPGGHGLRLVHLLADRWGVQAIGHGKVVWAEFDAERLRTGRRGRA